MTKPHFNPKTYYTKRQYSEQHLNIRRQQLFVAVLFMIVFTFIMWGVLSILPDEWYWVLPLWLIVEAVCVFAFLQIKRKAYKAKKHVSEWKSAEALGRMDPFDFEHYVAEMFRKDGYTNVQVVGQKEGQSGDGGIDIIMEKHGTKVAVQCKRYRADKQIGVDQVRAFLGSLAIQKIQRGIFITLSSFTKATWDEMKGSPVWLMDGVGFIRWTEGLPRK